MNNGLTAIIGGTGLKDTLKSEMQNLKEVEVETPFGKPSGKILTGEISGRKTAFINRHGQGHVYSPSQVPYAANIFAFKKLGAEAIIATAAVGSLREDIKPKDIVLVDQFIDKTYKRENTFFKNHSVVHCEFAEPVCGRLKNAILKNSETANTKIHPDGTYVCMEGPQFSTKAESNMHRQWGGDVIGMTAMPEAKLAREAQICYCLVALVSDYDCWRPSEQVKDKQTLLAEILGNLQTAGENAISVITDFLETDAEIISRDCTCRKSLELAVLTDKNKIDSKKQKELNVLFG
jgi:5'-methylthioadenosine phosphorylase